VEWLNPSTGAVTTTTTSGGGTVSFTPSFSGDAVLYLKASGYVPSPPTNLRAQ
jgi:hypothetical protein